MNNTPEPMDIDPTPPALLGETLQGLWELLETEICAAREVNEGMRDIFADMAEMARQTSRQPVGVLDAQDLMLYSHLEGPGPLDDPAEVQQRRADAMEKFAEVLGGMARQTDRRLLVPVPHELDGNVPSYWSLLELDVSNPDAPATIHHYPQIDGIDMAKVLGKGSRVSAVLEGLVRNSNPPFTTVDMALRPMPMVNDPWEGIRNAPPQEHPERSAQQMVIDLAETIMLPSGMQAQFEDTANIAALDSPIEPSEPPSPQSAPHWPPRPVIPLADTEWMNDRHVGAALTRLSAEIVRDYPEMIDTFCIGDVDMTRMLTSGSDDFEQAAYNLIMASQPEFIYLPIADTMAQGDYTRAQWSFVMLQRDRDITDAPRPIYQAYHYDSLSEIPDASNRLALRAARRFIADDVDFIPEGDMAERSQPHQSGDYMVDAIDYLVRSVVESIRHPGDLDHTRMLDYFPSDSPQREDIQRALGQ